MNLTAYSDSESDGEAPPAPKPIAKPISKSSFQKVVDRANPGRIKVNLPGASQSQAKDDIQDDAPPAKKPRLGGGGLGGFNAMLPAPKKPNVNAISAATSANTGARGLGKGLASGMNLKTGAEPAFRREPKINMDEYDEDGNVIKKEPMKKEDFRAMLKLPLPKTEKKGEETAHTTAEIPQEKPREAAKPAAPRFVPMSVGKGKKKKPAVLRTANGLGDTLRNPASAPSTSQPLVEEVAPARKPKVSLFGVTKEAEPAVQTASTGSYQPLLYGAEDENDAPIPDEAFEPQIRHPTHIAPAPTGPSTSSGLTNIASELNLSEAERRQLFGKKGKNAPDFSSAKIVEFNTDTEYAHNEKLRQQGEQIQHNALKSISGTGKNSLRSLVSAATTQKDALEDHFAAGHRNKREAGNRYGW
ncbi:hypothetical protein T440DRAFT_229262 [Plenodomus tracheiphilus IPT5]|uniref:Mitotic checkpoint regulator, MAD2B-interacting-domain-containing protein n=1 Tax=Plenodomus tracheiphilus IPT5 TaxID=1408161 RepID=A0A6A7ASW8_9PLEO|nr:hypothetical protein T440DRAFT_229262 [Plenodomus tracheiphilus IPT5]